MVMNFIRKLMYGRYGSDQLSFFLLVVYIVLILLSGLPHLEVLSWLALAGAVSGQLGHDAGGPAALPVPEL